MTKRKHPLAIDAFCGAGGLSLGLVNAGFDIKLAFDAEPAAASTYAENIGDHVVEARAEEISGSDALSQAGLEPGELTLLAGGPPCQGFSVQRRGSRKDNRNDLIFEFIRLADQLKPKFFLMENVPAILGPRARKYMLIFEEQALKAGYRTKGTILNAADFGVAQSRRRAFIVGEREDFVDGFSFPEPEFQKVNWRTVRDAIEDLPSPISDPRASEKIANHRLGNMSKANLERISHVPPGGGRADIPPDLRLPCHRVSVDKAGHRGVYGRLAWNVPAGTITTKCNSFTRGRFAHPEEDRNITMREAARIQGFPDSFVFLGGTVPVAHQIGNAVPPPLAAAIGGAVLEAYDPTRRAGGSGPPRQVRLPFRGGEIGRRGDRMGHQPPDQS